ncbi:MAG TPA: alcohol dehydrogenase catalytic domain-containing protein [Streptosporangiaceae bacterium]|jgi:L-iditol 2-dehydrogenase
MRTARLHKAWDIRIDEEPDPAPGEDESLVQVTAVGICGSDLHWMNEGAIGDATLAHPLVLGHEAAGVIASGPRAGQRVAIDPAIPCETCRACRDGYRNLCPRVRFAGHGETDGALRELMAWPDDRLHPLPATVSDAAGALLEPLGVAIQCVDLGHVPFGGTAAVVGCGPIGLLVIGLLKASGVSSVLAAEPLEHRRTAADRLGADTVTDLTTGYGVDVAFEVAGNSDAVQLAIDAARPGGRVVLAGIPDDDTTAFRASTARRKGLTIAMVRRMNEVYPRAIDLAARGVVDLDSLVTSRAGLADAAQAFQEASRRTGLKTVIEPQR